jgi:hypothetical protein
LYQLNPEPLREVDTWLEQYRQFWTASLNNLKSVRGGGICEGKPPAQAHNKNRKRRNENEPLWYRRLVGSASHRSGCTRAVQRKEVVRFDQTPSPVTGGKTQTGDVVNVAYRLNGGGSAVMSEIVSTMNGKSEDMITMFNLDGDRLLSDPLLRRWEFNRAEGQRFARWQDRYIRFPGCHESEDLE